MSDTTWDTLAKQFEETTTLSGRQAEVFTLFYIWGENHEEVAERLDISTTTVSRHRSNIHDKLDQSRALARLYDVKPFCTRVGESSGSYDVSLFENSGREDADHDFSIDEQYHLEVTHTQYPDDNRTKRVETTTKYRFADSLSIQDALQDGLADNFTEAAHIYAALNMAVGDDEDLPEFATLVDIEPDEAELERVIDNGVLPQADVHDFLDSSVVPESDMVGTHLGTDVPVTFDVREGRVTGILGCIGAGKAYTAKTLLNRLSYAEDAPNIVYFDILGADAEFGCRAGGTTYPLGEGIDAFTESIWDGLADVGGVDVQSAVDEGPDTSHVLRQAIRTLLNHLQSADEPAYIAIEQAHAMDAETWEMLMDAAESPDSALESWMFIGTPMEELLVETSTPLSAERDGVILHKRADFVGLDETLTSDHRNFVREARSGKADAPKQALASAPGTTQWLPVEIDPSLEELAVVAER